AIEFGYGLAFTTIIIVVGRRCGNCGNCGKGRPVGAFRTSCTSRTQGTRLAPRLMVFMQVGADEPGLLCPTGGLLLVGPQPAGSCEFAQQLSNALGSERLAKCISPYVFNGYRLTFPLTYPP